MHLPKFFNDFKYLNLLEIYYLPFSFSVNNRTLGSGYTDQLNQKFDQYLDFQKCIAFNIGSPTLHLSLVSNIIQEVDELAYSTISFMPAAYIYK